MTDRQKLFLAAVALVVAYALLAWWAVGGPRVEY